MNGAPTTTTEGWDDTKNVKLATTTISATTTDTSIKANLASIATGETEAPVCFASGTHIRTTSGDVALEDLVVGDMVVTISGARRPIKWLGHRKYRCAGYGRPQDILPIRIRANAIADQLPSRDSICFDTVGGVLIPANALINGTSIVQEKLKA